MRIDRIGNIMNVSSGLGNIGFCIDFSNRTNTEKAMSEMEQRLFDAGGEKLYQYARDGLKEPWPVYPAEELEISLMGSDGPGKMFILAAKSSLVQSLELVLLYDYINKNKGPNDMLVVSMACDYSHHREKDLEPHLQQYVNGEYKRTVHKYEVKVGLENHSKPSLDTKVLWTRNNVPLTLPGCQFSERADTSLRGRYGTYNEYLQESKNGNVSRYYYPDEIKDVSYKAPMRIYTYGLIPEDGHTDISSIDTDTMGVIERASKILGTPMSVRNVLENAYLIGGRSLVECECYIRGLDGAAARFMGERYATLDIYAEAGAMGLSKEAAEKIVREAKAAGQCAEEQGVNVVIRTDSEYSGLYAMFFDLTRQIGGVLVINDSLKQADYYDEYDAVDVIEDKFTGPGCERQGDKHLTVKGDRYNEVEKEVTELFCRTYLSARLSPSVLMAGVDRNAVSPDEVTVTANEYSIPSAEQCCRIEDDSEIESPDDSER